MNKMKLIILSLSVSLLISCSSPIVESVTVPVLKPVKYKTITPDEFACLSDETYLKFRYNDTASKARIKTLNGILGAINNDK